MRYSRERIKELTGIEIESDYGYLEVVDEKQYKTNRQTRAFHSLLMCFWKSGCSSFETYEHLRNHYKEVAHLLEFMFINDLQPYTKECLWKAVKLLPIKDSERSKVIELLRGKVLVWHSWSECNKEMATVTLNQLINDMFEAGVSSSSQGKKFEEILTGMRNWYE
jgi:hypothetical protein